MTHIDDNRSCDDNDDCWSVGVLDFVELVASPGSFPLVQRNLEFVVDVALCISFYTVYGRFSNFDSCDIRIYVII